MKITEIDWEATGSWMQAWAGFAGAFAVAIAALIGRSSFNNWLKQRQTERRLVVGERILKFAFEAKNAFAVIRNPATFSFEIKRADKEIADLDDADRPNAVSQAQLRQGVVINRRLTDHKELWAELFECLSLGRIFFGPEMEQAIRSLWDQRTTVYVSAMMYPEAEGEFRQKCEVDFWEGFGEAGNMGGDKVKSAVNTAFDQIEGQVLPIVTGNN